MAKLINMSNLDSPNSLNENAADGISATTPTLIPIDLPTPTLTTEATSPTSKENFLGQVEDFLRTKSLDEEVILNTITGLVEYGCTGVEALRESAGYPPDKLVFTKQLYFVGVKLSASDLLFARYVVRSTGTIAAAEARSAAAVMAGNTNAGCTCFSIARLKNRNPSCSLSKVLTTVSHLVDAELETS